MEFKLSKYIILSDSFVENDDQKESKIIFSCRKKMGIKIHAGLSELLKRGDFSILPDNIFSMLMHYEIIIPKEENEELYLLNLNRILYQNYEENEDKNYDLNNVKGTLSEYLMKEKSKLKEFMDNGEEFDFLDNNEKMYLVYVSDNENLFLPLNDVSVQNNYTYYSEVIERNIDTQAFLLPIDEYKMFGKIDKQNLEQIIENFKLKLLLKYKINAKNN